MKESQHYKKMPKKVKNAAKRAVKGRWVGFKAGQLENDRLKDFLWWRPKGIYTPYRLADGKVVWPVLVGSGVLKKCFSREAAEKAAQSNPDNVKRMEKLANLAGRLDDLEDLLGLERTGWPQCMNRPSHPLQHFIVVDLHSGWRAMFVTEPQSKSLADADSRGGRKFYAKPLEFLQKIINSVFLDLGDAAARDDVAASLGFKKVTFGAPGASPRFEPFFIGNKLEAALAKRGSFELVNKLWKMAAEAKPEGGKGLIDYFNEIAFEQRLHVMLFEEVGLPIDNLPEVEEVVKECFSFGTIKPSHIVLRESLVFAVNAVLVYGEAESHVWTAFAAKHYNYSATHIRFMVELQTKHEAARTREAETEEKVGTYYSFLSSKAPVVDEAAMVDDEAAPGPDAEAAPGADVEEDEALEALCTAWDALNLDKDKKNAVFSRFLMHLDVGTATASGEADDASSVALDDTDEVSVADDDSPMWWDGADDDAADDDDDDDHDDNDAMET
jgi:hypothetical protein